MDRIGVEGKEIHGAGFGHSRCDVKFLGRRVKCTYAQLCAYAELLKYTNDET